MTLGLRPGASGEGAAAADRGGLDFVQLQGDPEHGPIGEDPLSVAAFLMATTHRLGLVAPVAQSWAPFNVARALASFDHLSGGRGGWTPVQGEMGADQAAEHLDVVRQLFDSWDDDALAFDKAASIFADRTKARRIRHAGAFYTVDGPLNAPRPPQGHPVLFHPLAGATPFTDVALTALNDGPRPALPSSHTRILAEAPVSRGQDAQALARRLNAAFAAGACDGFLLQPAEPEADTAWLIEQVLPSLQGFSPAPPLESGGFRARLGLPRPANRFSEAS